MTTRRAVLAMAVALAAACLLPPASAAATTVTGATGKCTKKPFVGTVARTAEPGAEGQPAAERSTGDLKSALVYDFGNRKNFTVYLGDQPIRASSLGGTLEAPDGGMLVTMFLRSARGVSLGKGTKLRAGTDPLSVIVDAGAGASAVTSNPAGTVEILQLTDRNLCYRIDYTDDFQTVKGVVNAKIP